MVRLLIKLLKLLLPRRRAQRAPIYDLLAACALRCGVAVPPLQIVDAHGRVLFDSPLLRTFLTGLPFEDTIAMSPHRIGQPCMLVGSHIRNVVHDVVEVEPALLSFGSLSLRIPVESPVPLPDSTLLPLLSLSI